MLREEFIRITTEAANSVEIANQFSCLALDRANGAYYYDSAPITNHYARFYQSLASTSFINDRLDSLIWECRHKRWEHLKILRLIHLELFKVAYLDSEEYLEI